MAEAVVVVCDECGTPGATTITIRAGERNYVKDLCGRHLRALLADTRAPRRGRKRKVATPPAEGRARGAATRGGSAKRTAKRATKTARRKKRAAA
jgi:hypothetical protein